MNNSASIRLHNGLGDKLLDLTGFCVLCKYLGYNPHASFSNDGQFAWGNNNYDPRLFDFTGFAISDTDGPFFVNSPNPSASLCPYKVYEFLRTFLPNITFEQVSNDFIELSKQLIQPTSLISSNIPKNLERAYGIHLRKSDKVNNWCDIRHENPIHEFEIIINKLLEDVHKIILEEEEPAFLLVSEDDVWRQQVGNIILGLSATYNKPIKLIDIDYGHEGEYSNYNSVLDMFCLSKCKEILQGVKYSTFSILASLLGNKKLRNYSHFTQSYEVCLIHSWASVVQINGAVNVDIELHKQVTGGVTNINTNIGAIFN